MMLRFLLLWAVMLMTGPALGSNSLPPLSGEIILTVGGNIAFANVGEEAQLDEALTQLQALQARADSAAGLHLLAIALQQDALMGSLNHIANQVMMAEWESTGARLDTYRHSLVQVIASILGITLSGAVLVLLLVKALGQRRTAQRALLAGSMTAYLEERRP